MKNTKLPVKRIKRAQVRYFEVDNGGSEIPDIKAYTYFLEINGVYINIFHPLEDCNVYKRVPYTNSTKDGENYGTKISLVNGREEDGVCYILDLGNDNLFEKDYISIEELEDRIVDMSEFIIDRVNILESRRYNKDIFKKMRIIRQDQIKMKELQKYINSKEEEKSIKKIKN